MKKRRLAVAVTTEEAMKACLAEEMLVFCIENPLYSAIYDRLDTMEELRDYDLEKYTDKQVVLLRKARGEHRFPAEEFEVFYLPLQWDGWTS